MVCRGRRSLNKRRSFCGTDLFRMAELFLFTKHACRNVFIDDSPFNVDGSDFPGILEVSDKCKGILLYTETTKQANTDYAYI